ncbi:MAG: hypothetical protein IKM55_03470 [Bacilli bacterium]|nr:hypothetical protein [Bacillota bacterium]MBR6821262.1 hypothetical protein [Bacilli bacterium]
MKKYGKVLVYDGYVGNIIDNEGTKYIFTTRDLNSKNIVSGDFVSFNSEVFETVEIKEYTARYITKVTKEDIKPTDK